MYHVTEGCSTHDPPRHRPFSKWRRRWLPRPENPKRALRARLILVGYGSVDLVCYQVFRDLQLLDFRFSSRRIFNSGLLLVGF